MQQQLAALQRGAPLQLLASPDQQWTGLSAYASHPAEQVRTFRHF